MISSSEVKKLNVYLKESDFGKVFFLVDTNTHEYCFPILIPDLHELGEYEIIEIDPGEENKSLEIAANLWSVLSELGCERNDLILNLGGGVVTDLGGFIASTFKRGIRFVNVPTSLLAMVDAAHGGKTGVDLGSAKNLIGTFTKADDVFIYSEFLNTLPENQLKSGFAEMLKHGLISSKEHWQNCLAQFPNISNSLIEESISIKNKIVESDVLESGQRKTLNFGHTVGHAIESFYLEKKDPILHGEAVAAGMIIEAELSKMYLGLSDGDFNEVVTGIDSFFDRLTFGLDDLDSIVFWLKHDKKNQKGKLQFSLITEIGVSDIDIEVSIDSIVSSLEHYLVK